MENTEYTGIPITWLVLNPEGKFIRLSTTVWAKMRNCCINITLNYTQTWRWSQIRFAKHKSPTGNWQDTIHTYTSYVYCLGEKTMRLLSANVIMTLLLGNSVELIRGLLMFIVALKNYESCIQYRVSQKAGWWRFTNVVKFMDVSSLGTW